MTGSHSVIGVPPPLTPPHKGEGDAILNAYAQSCTLASVSPGFPSPLWGGGRGGGTFSPWGALQ
jgi:hypothetical protein